MPAPQTPDQPGDKPESALERALRMSMGVFRRPAQNQAAASPAPGFHAEDPVERAHVLLSVSQSASPTVAQFDRIYVGTVGSVGPDQRFYVHPDYAQIAYLYAIAPAAPTALDNTRAAQALPGMEESGLAPDERLLAVDLPASAHPAFRANMIEVASRRWGAMYAEMAQSLPKTGRSTLGLGIESLRNDERTTANNVAAFMQRNGMHLWDVPVVYEVLISEEDPSIRGTTEADLLKCHAIVSNLQVAPPQIAPTHLADAPRANAGQTETAPQPAEWLTHAGPIKATVEGTLRVRARDAAQANLVAAAMIQTAKAAPQLLEQFLAPTPTAIAAAQMLPSTTQNDDEGDYWGERGMRDM